MKKINEKPKRWYEKEIVTKYYSFTEPLWEYYWPKTRLAWLVANAIFFLAGFEAGFLICEMLAIQ